MYCRIRIYRVHDPDIYAMYMTLGRTLFREAVKDAIRAFLTETPRITGTFQIQPVNEFQGEGRMKQVSITMNEKINPEIVRLLSTVHEKNMSLFIKTILRTVFMKEFLQFMTDGNVENKFSVTSTPALPSPLILPSKEEQEKIKKPVKKASVKPAEPAKPIVPPVKEIPSINKNEKENKEEEDIPDGIAGLMGLIGGLTVE